MRIIYSMLMKQNLSRVKDSKVIGSVTLFR